MRKSSTQNPLYRILVVEDNAEMLMLLTDVLSDEGYAISQAADGAEAALKLTNQAFDLVITDINMPNMGGLELLSLVQGKSPAISVIMITAFGDGSSKIHAFDKGAVDYIRKPFKMMDLKNAVKKALDNSGPKGRRN